MTGELKRQASAVPLVPVESAGGLKRSHQVKVTLNAAELEFLDRVVAQMGSDRSSVFRHLLRLAAGGAFSGADESSLSDGEAGVSGLESPLARERDQRLLGGVKMFEPRAFDEIPVAIQALREEKIVLLNLTMVTPDQAQRSVDFVAGGTFALDGHQERVGESIFLFAPSCVPVEAVAAASVAAGKQQVKGSTPPLLAETPFEEPAPMDGAVSEADIPQDDLEPDAAELSVDAQSVADDSRPEDIS
jgi:hypothetical protein